MRRWTLVGGIIEKNGTQFVCFHCGTEVSGDLCEDAFLEEIRRHVREHTPFEDLGFESRKILSWPQGYDLYIVAPFEIARAGGPYSPDEEVRK